MKRLLWMVVAVVVVAGSVASAELCDGCKDKMFDTAVGKCRVCGGQTPSRGFKLCKDCSNKLGECEACRKKLKKAATQPAATTQPATQPSKSPPSSLSARRGVPLDPMGKGTKAARQERRPSGR
jgi:hypothetical protein